MRRQAASGSARSCAQSKRVAAALDAERAELAAEVRAAGDGRGAMS